MSYSVELTPKAVRELGKLDRSAQARVRAAIDLLAENPRPPAAQPLKGQPRGTYRVRTGDYRVIYEVHDDRLLVMVIRLGHRREVYRRLRS